MSSHDLRLLVWLDAGHHLRQEFIRGSTLIWVLLLVHHDHVALLGVLHAF
jgi:hypothetical protein